MSSDGLTHDTEVAEPPEIPRSGRAVGHRKTRVAGARQRADPRDRARFTHDRVPARKAGECDWCGKILELMDTVDEYIPLPVRITDQSFLMPIEDVFGIKGRGTVVTGRVERGILNVGQDVEIVGFGEVKKTVATGLEMFHKLLDATESGDAVGVLLRGVDREDVERGQVLARPGSIEPHIAAEAEVYVLSREEGGRHTPFFNGYKPQFYIRTSDITGEIQLPEGVEMVVPGDNITMKINLIYPIALEAGLRFAIREGGRTVGAGVFTKIVE